VISCRLPPAPPYEGRINQQAQEHALSIRKSVPFVIFAIAVASPVAALADPFWITTDDEAGSRIVVPAYGSIAKSAPIANVTPLQTGDVSPDRQYVFLGEESGWQLRPMEYRLEGGRFVHVDDPAGHMSRVADNSPLTEQERIARERLSGG
jgi:hypothetical protein